MAKKVGILTGGGDCPGLNPAIRGCVMRGMDFGFEFVGLLEGWKGLIEGNTMPLGLGEVADIIGESLLANPDVAALQARVTDLTDRFPLYPGLEQW